MCQIYEDQFFLLYNDSKCYGIQGEKLDLVLLVDGLQVECEQGIIIDVVYCYFLIEKCKFIIVDILGYEQYMCNMVIGVFICDLVILLIDVCKGVFDQICCYSFILMLLGIKYLVVVINKMDFVEFSEVCFNEIWEDYLIFVEQLLGNFDICFVLLLVLEGDNVVSQSVNMLWYSGLMLLEVFEIVEIQWVVESQLLCFLVQYVNCLNFDFCGFFGMVVFGIVQVGQCLKVLLLGVELSVVCIVIFDGDLQEVVVGEVIIFVLKDEIDISCGDLLVDV